MEVYFEVWGEEWEREEDDCDGGKYEDGGVLRVSNNCEFVEFDGLLLEDLFEGNVLGEFFS